MRLTSADERAHRPGGDRLWQEAWYFDFAARDGTLGGYVRLGCCPHSKVAWYWAALVGEDRPLVTVIDHDVRLPRARTLEIRADGLWADHTVETAYEHMTLGLESFAVAVDDPTEVYGDLRGDRVPLGFDLEWETHRGGVFSPSTGTTRYEIACEVHGEILVGDEVIAFEGLGQRNHAWGVHDWWSVGWVWAAGALDDGTRFHGLERRGPGPQRFSSGYVLPAHGPIEPGEVTAAAEEVDARGFPLSASIRCGDLDLTLDPVAFSPVPLVDDAGGARRIARLARALCRLQTADGRRGAGWMEWNQPPVRPA